MIIRRIQRDDRGVAAVEVALVLPLLFVFIYGIFQLGAIFAANAIMQGALGEGARFATVWPVRTDAQIRSRIESKVINIYAGNFVVSDPVTTTVAATATASAVKKTDLTITYNVTTDLVFFPPRSLTLTRRKTAYMAIEAVS